MARLDYKSYYRRQLPHIQPKWSVLFITYRLAFSLPENILEAILKKKNELKGNKIDKSKYSKLLFFLEDDLITKYSNSPQWLSDKHLAQTVIDSLLFNHGKEYKLICVLVMSNHVHMVIMPLMTKDNEPFSISKILKDHKGYVAHQANKYLNISGAFWQHESYDHFIRDEIELIRIIRYILNNPVKAGLVKNYTEWKYYWINKEYIEKI
jgi:putative transposase